MGSSVFSQATNSDNRQAATDNAFVAGVSGNNSALGLATLSGISGAADVIDNKAGVFKGVNAGSLGYSMNSNNVTNITDGKAFDLVGSAIKGVFDLSKSTTSDTLKAMLQSEQQNAAQAAKMLKDSNDAVAALANQQQAAISNLSAQQTASVSALTDGVLGAAARLAGGVDSFGKDISVGFGSFTEAMNTSAVAQGKTAQETQKYLKIALVLGGLGLVYVFLKGKK